MSETITLAQKHRLLDTRGSTPCPPFYFKWNIHTLIVHMNMGKGKGFMTYFL